MGHVSALVLWFVAVYDVPSTAVVDDVQAFLVTVVGCCVEVKNAGGIIVFAAAVGVGVGVAGASVADDVGSVDVVADGDVGVAGVEGAAGIEGVEGACGGDNTVGVFVIAGVCSIEDVAAAPVIIVVVVETQSQWGVGEFPVFFGCVNANFACARNFWACWCGQECGCGGSRTLGVDAHK